MWDGFEPLLGEREVMRHELRGFGETPMPPSGKVSHADDLQARLSQPVVLVGASFGGHVCLDLAARRPELVAALVLIGAPLFDHDFSEEFEAYGAEEERLLDAGDVEGVADLNVSFWIGEADPEIRDTVRGMQLRALRIQLSSEAEAEVPDSIQLERIEAPALVMTGERDHEDFQAIAARLVEELPNATSATISDAQHLPALERPEQTARVVMEFLERAGR